MEILDKNIPIPTIPIPTEWAHEAVARATHALEPLTDQFRSSRPSGLARVGSALGRHPYAVGATVVVLAGVAYLAMRNSSAADTSVGAVASEDERPVRSVA